MSLLWFRMNRVTKRILPLAQVIGIGAALGLFFLTWRNTVLTKKAVEIAGRQLESTVEPAIDIFQSGPFARLRNAGSWPATDLEVVASLAAHIDLKEGKILRHQISLAHILIAEELSPDEALQFQVSDHIISLPAKTGTGETEAYCLMLRYKRPADGRPFGAFLTFIRLPGEDPITGGDYLYFPVGITPGSTLYSPGGEPWLKNLRSELQQLCLQQEGLAGIDVP